MYKFIYKCIYLSIFAVFSRRERIQPGILGYSDQGWEWIGIERSSWHSLPTTRTCCGSPCPAYYLQSIHFLFLLVLPYCLSSYYFRSIHLFSVPTTYLLPSYCLGAYCLQSIHLLPDKDSGHPPRALLWHVIQFWHFFYPRGSLVLPCTVQTKPKMSCMSNFEVSTISAPSTCFPRASSFLVTTCNLPLHIFQDISNHIGRFKNFTVKWYTL